ncbi:MAG: adenylosuccinate lyase [Bacteroidetes bacterium]|nr:adenylosuccinate lyase [Bacteroidota bacterium]
MDNLEINAISPIDGRYYNNTKKLREFFSEAALIKYRVYVEIEYFIALYQLPIEELNKLSEEKINQIKLIYQDFKLKDAARVKEIEKTTNHDIKAVEYFIKEKFEEIGLSDFKEFIHFGLTSQDINNTAFPLMLKEALYVELIPAIEKVMDKLESMSEEYKNQALLAFTHGQPASPTALGKELYVFLNRLDTQINHLKSLPFPAKFGGATGNLNAHLVAYPEINWIKFANNFVENNLGLKRSKVTTQIEHYDNIASIFDCLKRICTIIIDLDRDMWTYISKEYFKQKIKENEVGSSAMPHKVNPIDFENSEGNLGIAIAIFEHLSAKLPISRLQRDLTDSTVLRNIGVPMAHMLISLQATIKGLEKVILNKAAIDKDLDANPMVIAEAIQTILRKLNYPKPYETLKELTRTNEAITLQHLYTFIDSLDIPENYKAQLKSLTPSNYTGYNLDALIK